MDGTGKFGRAQGGGRREDIRFLTGAGRYVDDIAPEGSLYAVFVRSMVAHGRLGVLDLDAARAMPGVHLVLGCDDLVALGVDPLMKGARVKGPAGMGAGPERPVLARGTVHFAGEAVVAVIADSIEAAKDAAEAIDLNVDALPVWLDLAPGGATIHPQAPENLAYTWDIGDAPATDAAFDGAAHVVSLDVVHNRIIVNAMEPRGAFAEWADGRLHLCVNGQGVWNQRSELARMLGMDHASIRVTNPDVGGGFGMKAMTYPEYVVIAAAARALARPVRWISERGEGMLSDNAGRDLVARAELAFDRDLRIKAYRVNLVSNLGAYNSQFGQPIQSELFSKVLTGVYDIKVAHLRAVGVYTNTTPVDAYRGAGRPEAILTIERAMDAAARTLGVDAADLRRRNFITQFPYHSVVGEVIDGGDFAAVLARAQIDADVDGFAKRRADSAVRGMLRGIGLAVYIEAILGDQSETARLTLDADGGATLYVGTQSNGQGHETVYARMVAAQTGLDEASVRIVQGDSDAIPAGGGTGGSRSVTVQGTATRATVLAVVASFEAFLSHEWGVEGVAFDGTAFGAPGSNLRLTLTEAAAVARSRDRLDLLDTSRRATLDGRSFPNGAHLAEVEIDPETGALTLERYTVADDFGTLIAPELAMGQVHGGVAQGFGQAVMENAVYDDHGQLLSGSFMDYAMPRAGDMPMIHFASVPVPTATNPLGMKGCGEAGTVGALGAVSNAVMDALAQKGVGAIDMPFTPQRLWQALQAAKGGVPRP